MKKLFTPILLLAVFSFANAQPNIVAHQKVDASLLEKMAGGQESPFLILLAQQADLSTARSLKTKDQKAAFLNSLKLGTTKTASGLKFKILKKGSGGKPAKGETVYMNYAGFLEDGTLFDTSYEAVAEENGVLDLARKEANEYKPFPFSYGNKTGLIAGFIEGLEKMNFGDKAILIIPGHLGYGEQGTGPIPPNATIIFEVELLEKQ